MIELVEKAFAPELLLISPAASQLVDFAWTIYNIGGVIPVPVISEQFPDAEEHVTVLGKAGILRYSLGGFVDRSVKKQSVSVMLDEDFEKGIARGVTRKEFESIIFRKHGDKLISYCRSELTEPLAVMLTSVLFYTTPNGPVFVNKVVRRASKVTMKGYAVCKNILDYYLHRFLGLVQFETGSMINLSVRSQQRVRLFPKLWELYNRAYTEKPSDQPIQPIEPKAVPARVNEQEKRLKGYFPWLKL